LDSQTNIRQSYSVLMVAPTSFFSDYGCSVRILEEIRALQGLGHRVVVCTYRNGQGVSGMTIRRTLGIPFRGHYEVGSSLHKVAFDLLLFWTVLFAALRDRPDVIHAHMHEGALIGNLVGRLLRIPLVFDFQGSLTGEMMDHGFLHKESLFYGPLRWLERTIDSASPTILTSSKNARRMLMTDFGCPPEKVVAVSDCVDCKTFYPRQESEEAELADRRAMLGIPPGRKLVVYLGLLADYQGTDLLLQAAARLLQQRDDLHFLIMGFPAVAYYQEMAMRLGVFEHTTFTGKVPYELARDHLAVGEVAVAPKLSLTEGNGKVLNYMAMGLPIAAFETPVSREYLGDLGIYATRGDPDSLAEAILFGLTEQEAERQRSLLRQRALDIYSWDRASETIIDAYGSVCDRQPAVL
jgi:glycosyltransferase involved in cell wall biosynthesis